MRLGLGLKVLLLLRVVSLVLRLVRLVTRVVRLVVRVVGCRSWIVRIGDYLGMEGGV